ncbi:MAG: DUF2723 domain-containing protein [Balneolales bacterium]|nr:DUF2723 domain-containing protein [Balneolales bacterium]
MFSDHKSTNKYLALFAFLVSLIIYSLTMAPTASFWDAGEFIAVAHGLQVNHPPGAPFYSIVGRLFSMFMPTEYIAASINFISVLSSALTIMLLYLVIVRLIQEFKGKPEEMNILDKIGMYGGALVGALTFSVTDTFWFNAVEAEVYAPSMFFTAIVVWLALKWSENHDKDYSERWLVLIAYMFGLAIGVHLLNLLAIFFVALIVYFKKRDFTLISFSIMGAITVAGFFIVYPVTIQWIPDWTDKVGDATYGLIGPFTFVLLIIGSLSWAIYYTHKNKYRLANIALLSYGMILIGYSSYAVIMIRSIADPPIDENDPETVEDFVKYLKREQYGDTPIFSGRYYDDATGQITQAEEKYFPRRWSSDPRHVNYYSRYSSDLSYFVNYQINHMYVRYFNWNFIGREADIQDAGWQSGFGEPGYPENRASNAYFFIPFLLGLFGMIYHFSNDWRRAFAVLTLFIVTGVAIIVFLNQTPFQPRERDYAYVGSFFAFAIWIGLGVTGLVELSKAYLKDNKVAAYAIIGLTLLASPVWMGFQNWDDHDRSDRYVAPDYAKNLLASVAPNGIIFTNGDNDTFPLWYVQEVEGFRTDVRIVCLSLLNTDWYIKQMRDQWSHESAPLPINLTDEEIERMTSRIDQWQPRDITIPVDKEMLRQAFSEDYVYKEAIGVRPDTSLPILQTGTDFEMPVDSLDNELRWRVNGRLFTRDAQGNGIYYMQVQDLMILEILQANDWLRPVYFANTVSETSMLGLNDAGYFRTEGKAYRVIPKKMESQYNGFIDPKIHTHRLEEFSFTEWNNQDVYFDENIRRMLGNYRYSFLQLAETYQDLGMPDSAAYYLNMAEEKIPFRPDEENYNLPTLFAVNYIQLDRLEDAARVAKFAAPVIMKDFNQEFNRFIAAENKFQDLNEEFEEARRSGDVRKQRDLRPRVASAHSQREQLGNSIVSTRQFLSITLYGLLKSNSDDEAQEMISDVNSKLEGTPFSSLLLPTSIEESEMEMRRYGLIN